MCCTLPHGFHLPTAGSSCLFSLPFPLFLFLIPFVLFNSPICKPSFYLSLSLHAISISARCCSHWCLFYLFPVTKSYIFALQFCTLFPTASPAPHSSIFAFFLHMSWHHHCVPNVPHTLFSTIKLLSLLFLAASRITWAEGALFKYRAALGRRKTGVWRKERKDERERKRKCKKKTWNKMNWGDYAGRSDCS